MIENLQGVHEILDYGNDSIIRLYDNSKVEDYPLHWHHALEVILPLENTYSAICNNVTYHLNEGDLLFIQPAVLHRLISPKEGRRVIFQISLNHLTFLKSFTAITSQLPSALIVTKKSHPYEAPILHNLMMEIFEEYQSTSPIREVDIYAKTLQMLFLLGEHLCTQDQKQAEKTSLQQEYIAKFTEICDYIDAHLTENLTLDEMANKAGFSKFHFTRLFKQFTNYSFYQYVNVRRIHHAQLLLVEPDITVTEAAYRSGFSNTSAFDRMFKLHKNCTPTEFRKLYLN